MKLNHRKTKEFDYAALRIGNVYVLPPEEQDVLEFNRKRRREITRRGFIVGGAALALGVLAVPFLPGKSEKSDVARLFDLDPANANKEVIRALCLNLYRHEDARVRIECARGMSMLENDREVKNALWHLIHKDKDMNVRKAAVTSLILQGEVTDHPDITRLYHDSPWAQGTIDTTIDQLGFFKLKEAISVAH